MINLLPLQQKKSLHNLLVLKEIAFFLWGVFFIEIVCVIFLVPVYFFLKAKTTSSALEVANLKNSESFIVDKSMNTTIDDINSKLTVFPKTFSEIYPSSDILIPLTKHRVAGISITGITFETRTPNNEVVKPAANKKTVIEVKKPDIEIRGVAKNRLALLAFQKSLESDPLYSVVTVPISDFVKGENITFSILITTTL